MAMGPGLKGDRPLRGKEQLGLDLGAVGVYDVSV